MCGIVGIIRSGKPAGKEEIERMTSALSHRGPDGSGIWREHNVAIGHRRLSIIDLETGQQPMCNEDGTVWITYNGELYNFPDLRKNLEERGHRFKTRSDTEVIVHAYEEWRDACVERFRGMFAFGIVDQKRQRVFLARDHLGIKPLVYYSDGDCCAFASEIQALRPIDGARFSLDLQAIDQYLWLQYIPPPRSVFKEVKKLPPAHRMSVTFDGHVSEPEEYWRIEFKPDHGKSEQDWLEGLDAVLTDSVKAHLVADVPFGAFLSGGVDSSAVVAYMARVMERPVKTFSIGFEEDAYNELKYAEVAAKRWGTEHHFAIVRPNALEILPTLVRHYGEPFGDSSAVPTYYVCKMARQHVPMVLSGDGGDETFAGYHSYLAWMKYLSGGNPPVGPAWKQALYPYAQRLFPSRYPAFLKHGAELENWLSFINYIPTRQRKSLWRREYHHVVSARIECFEKEFSRAGAYTHASKGQYLDLKTYLPFDILTKVDVASMMNSLEVRTPFADRRVVEFAATIPESFNIRKDETGEWHGKLLVKKLMERFYPADFVSRRKMGFGVPLQTWFARTGSLHGEVVRRLTGKDSQLHEYFNPTAMGKLIHDNLSGPVWLLLFLEEWLREHERK